MFEGVEFSKDNDGYVTIRVGDLIAHLNSLAQPLEFHIDHLTVNETAFALSQIICELADKAYPKPTQPRWDTYHSPERTYYV